MGEGVANHIAFKIIYSILTIIIGICIITFSIIMFIRIRQNNEIFDDLLENWENDPIESFYVISNNQSCSDGYSLFEFKWPGTVQGCECAVSIPFKIRLGYCCTILDVAADTDDECCYGDNIDQVDPITIDTWRIPEDGPLHTNPEQNKLKVCFKTIKDYNFKNHSKKLKCNEQTEQTCGDINDKNSFYCVPKESKCPLRNIIFAQTNPDSSKYELIIDFQKDAKALTSLKLFGQRQSLKLPISEFRITLGEGVCAQNDRPNIYENDKYILEKRDKCDTFVDNRFEQVQGISISERDYFSATPKIFDKVTNLYEYNIDKKDLYKLYARNYVFLEFNCRDDIDQYYSINENIDEIEKMSLIMMIFCILLSVCLVFIDSFIGYSFKKYFWGVIVFKKNISWWVRGYYIVKFLFLTITLIVASKKTAQNTIVFKFLDRQILENCVNEQTIKQFVELKDRLSQNLMVVLVTFVWFYIFIEPNVCYLLYKLLRYICNMCRGSNKYIEKGNNQNNYGKSEVQLNVEQFNQKQQVNPQYNQEMQNYNYNYNYPPPQNQNQFQMQPMENNQFNMNANFNNDVPPNPLS